MRGRLPINLLALAPEQRHKALQKATDNCFFYLRKNMFDECLFLVRYALELSRHLSAFRRKERESVCERRRNTAREVHTRARKRERARERERERDRMKERDMCIYIYIYILGGGMVTSCKISVPFSGRVGPMDCQALPVGVGAK